MDQLSARVSTQGYAAAHGHESMADCQVCPYRTDNAGCKAWKVPAKHLGLLRALDAHFTHHTGVALEHLRSLPATFLLSAF